MAEQRPDTTRLYFHPDAVPAEAWTGESEGATMRLDVVNVHEVRAESLLYERDGDRWRPRVDGARDLEPLERGLICRTWKTAVHGEPAWGFACVNPPDPALLEKLALLDEDGLALRGTPSFFVLLEKDAASFLRAFKAIGGLAVRVDALPEDVSRAHAAMETCVDEVRTLRESDLDDLKRARQGDLSVGAGFERRTRQLVELLERLRQAAQELRAATAPQLGQGRSKEERQSARQARLEADELLQWAQLEYEQRSTERLELDGLEAAAEGRRSKQATEKDPRLAIEIAELALSRLLEHGPVEFVVGDQRLRVVDGRFTLV
jgi:hypothetical protein